MDLNNKIIQKKRERLKGFILRSDPVPLTEEHKRLCKLEFDYEVNNFFNAVDLKANLLPRVHNINSQSNSNSNINSNYNSNYNSNNLSKNISQTFSEKDSLSEKEENNNNNKVDKYMKLKKDFKSFIFQDDYVPRYYKCSYVPFYKKNHFKALISNQRIRFIDNDFDLDLW
jgi:hypothetical protein